MSMKQLGNILKNLPAKSMVKRHLFQSTKQDITCSERRKQCQTYMLQPSQHALKIHMAWANFQTME